MGANGVVVAQVVALSAVALELNVTVVPVFAVSVAGGVVPAFTFTAVVTPAVVAWPAPAAVGIPLAFTAVPKLAELPPLLPPVNVPVVA